MLTNEVKPIDHASEKPPKGAMTKVGLAAIVLFVVALAFIILRPVVDRHDGPETGVPQVDRPAIQQTGP